MTPSAPDRYHRQTLLPDVGGAGQRRLGAGHAVIVGCGALGCASADLLARAGVGTLTLIDRDVVELTNLQRQTLYEESDAERGLPKAEAAAARLGRVNSAIVLRPVVADLAWRNAERLVCGAGTAPGVVIDGTDTFGTRYLLNDLCVQRGLPFVYAGAVGTTAMSMTVLPGETPCLRCIARDPPPPGATPTCDTAGVLGPAVVMIAAHQAVEAMKVLLGRRDLLNRGLVTIDPWRGVHREVEVGAAKDPACPCCGGGGEGGRSYPFLSGERGASDAVLCGRDAVQVSPEGGGGGGAGLDLAELAERLRPHGPVAMTRYCLRATFGGHALTVFADGRALIGGTTDAGVARSVYARAIGG